MNKLENLKVRRRKRKDFFNNNY